MLSTLAAVAFFAAAVAWPAHAATAGAVDLTLTNTTARLTGSGAGQLTSTDGQYKQTSRFDGGVRQRQAVTQTVAENAAAVEFNLPVGFDGLPSAETTWETTYGCQPGGTNPTLSESSSLVPAPGGTGDGEITMRVQLAAGRPLGLVVVDSGDRADSIIREGPDSLRATWTTSVENCDRTSSTDVREEAVHHGSYLMPAAFSPLGENAAYASSAPQISIDFQGCEPDGTCTYRASYGRAYTHNATGWSSSAWFTLTTDIIVATGDRSSGTDCGSWRGGFTTRDYRGYVSQPGPNLDLFWFSPSVKYRFTEKCVQVVQAWSHGGVDWGLDTYALELLGFKVRYDEGNVRFGKAEQAVEITGSTTSGLTARLSGDFDVTFDWTALIGRLKVKDKLTNGLADELEKMLAKRIRKYGYKDGVQRWLVDANARAQFKTIAAFEKQLDRITSKLPDFLAGPIKKYVMDKVEGFTKRLSIYTAGFSSYTATRVAANEIAQWYVDGVWRDLKELLDGPDAFSVWSPDVYVSVAPGGAVSYRLDGFANPFLSTEVIPGSERNFQGAASPSNAARPSITPRTPADVAATVARQTASGLSPKALSAKKGARVRVAAAPGGLTLTLTAKAAPGRASVARARRGRSIVLARGASSSLRSGWRSITVRSTRAGRRALEGKRRAKLRITVKFRSRSGGASTKHIDAVITGSR